ncbi:hypothetical protein EXM36_18720 [Clostridium botulinum]|uniref:sublancin family glycopeptide n=1 Tax=Clostridium botulinum TaxID=1491 RepID=UPI000A173AC7|nr:sublancin family glycopeptide [Clostridium botulinum]HDR5605917.1 hypothetical protein [Bacillus anthracis]NEZ73672.1 hypothetical protein [Clostridium botulinum]NFA40960.1 hypothetical protein [Clostridium botulinum]NFA75957.1 hypothetical protein [Clostridium botulinum]NFB51201.1 hypothetical protein [Clostridium botulinum]
MKELLEEVNFEELELEETEEITGGGGISSAQCSYWWALCFTGASDTYGCGSTAANCEYYKRYC